MHWKELFLFNALGLVTAKTFDWVDWTNIAEAGLKGIAWTLGGIVINYLVNQGKAWWNKKKDNQIK